MDCLLFSHNNFNQGYAMLVQPLLIGPIIGHTTPSSFRVGGSCLNANSCIGVIRVRESESSQFLPIQTFLFSAHYNNMGIVDAQSLDADTTYCYEVGYVICDTQEELTQDIEEDKLVWGAEKTPDLNGQVTTFPDNDNATTRFIMGSCRDSFGNKGEETFDNIYAYLDETDEELRPTMLFMLGDQIYIDHAHLFDKYKFRPKIEDYFKEYNEAFGLYMFNKVTRQLPCYMMMDDHEVQNDWSLGKFQEDESKVKQQFNKNTLVNGLRAYEAHQAAFSNLIKSPEQFIQQNFSSHPNACDLNDKKYWYDFKHGNSDFFFLDVRGDSEIKSKKYEAEHTTEPKIISDTQYEELCKWLSDGSGKVKFIASSIPVFPDTRGKLGSPEDKWFLAAKQRVELLDYIRTLDSRPQVVFLSGDVHISAVAQLTYEDDPTFKVFNVISSAFHWFAPGLQEAHFNWGKLLAKKARADHVEDGNTTFSKYNSESVIKTLLGKPKIFKRNNFAVVCIENFDGENRVSVEFRRGKDYRHILNKTNLDF